MTACDNNMDKVQCFLHIIPFYLIRAYWVSYIRYYVKK